MAKKSKSKGRPASRKPAPRKAAAKARPKAKSKTKAKASAGPRPVSSGKGLAPEAIGRAVVEGFNSGVKDHELWNKFWHTKAVSVEGSAQSQWEGRKAMDAKAAWWASSHTLHGASAEGPFVGATGFAIKFRVDVTENASAKRMLMEEVGVYTVQNGKIIREEFMSGSMQIVGTPPPLPAGA